MATDTTIVLRDGNNNPISIKARILADGSLAFHHIGNPTGQPVTQTIITVSAAQAAGTAALIPAKETRNSISFQATKDFNISVDASATYGMKVFATAGDTFEGSQCPTNAIYAVANSGLITGDTVLTWET